MGSHSLKKLIVSIVGITGAILILWGGINLVKLAKIVYLSKEQLMSLNPQSREVVLRAIEEPNRPTLISLSNEIEIIQRTKMNLVRIEGYIEKEEYTKALNLIITVKGHLEKIKLLDVREIKTKVEELRKELHNAVKKSGQQ